VSGTLLQTPAPDLLEVRRDVVIAVGADGTILGVHPAGSAEAHAASADAEAHVRLRPGQRLLPGLIDTHIHAPQWPQLGTGLDIPLEQWLFEYTFPLESKYADDEFAQDVWDHMVPTLLAHGTTTAVYYGTVHERATLRLAQTCLRHGQRAWVGRVAMDHPEGTPDWYRDTDAAEGVAASARSIEAIRSLDDPLDLVEPIITPRFIPACTDELLGGLGALARTTGVLVQTHCSESDWEHGYVIERHGITDTESLFRLGLLRRGTVLAHGNHLGDGDLDLIEEVGAGVAHCPLSNAYFAGAVFPTKRALAKGVHVGLGSDVSGGAQPGLLPQCAMAVTATRIGEDGVDADRPAAERGLPGTRIDTVAALHLATLGGADILGAPLGLIAEGRQFDAIVVDVDRAGSPLRWWDGIDTEERIVEKIVRLATPADISGVWVAGRRVVG
jgi:guanine deaminase